MPKLTTRQWIGAFGFGLISMAGPGLIAVAVSTSLWPLLPAAVAGAVFGVWIAECDA